MSGEHVIDIHFKYTHELCIQHHIYEIWQVMSTMTKFMEIRILVFPFPYF